MPSFPLTIKLDMKKLLVFILLTGCSSTKYWTEEYIQMYSNGFFHGCAYVESQKEMNLNGLVDCANKHKQLIEFHRRIRKKK